VSQDHRAAIGDCSGPPAPAIGSTVARPIHEHHARERMITVGMVDERPQVTTCGRHAGDDDPRSSRHSPKLAGSADAIGTQAVEPPSRP
jgi:hypothetical protein